MTSTPENSDAIRLTVADILTSMAMGAEPITPTTFAVLDGLSGVPTRTTPTLTPTTLKNIEQVFLDVESGRNAHQHEAGFVPPVAPLIPTTVTSQAYPVSTSQSKVESSQPDYQQSGFYSTFEAKPLISLTKSSNRGRGQTTPMNLATTTSNDIITITAVRPKKVGGRRPVNISDGLPQEEVHKRLLRRERNKAAAARCRKRRLDHTLLLVDETERLEEIKRNVQHEIETLELNKLKLERILLSHKSECKMVKVKEEVIEEDIYAVPVPRKRPNTLYIPTFKNSETQTPSAGLGLNIDSLMAGGTGLTPVTSAMTTLVGSFPCSSQNRNPNTMPLDLSSPDTGHSKLISL
ncbi:transcription factor kayak-like isoform X2 [Artemia franciscana]|nr:hypothetical protein QYM36_014738 [Artemia franciscana]